MIKRYSRPEMTKVWSQKEKYRIWFEIEAYACEAMEQFGSIPKGTTNNVLKASGLEYDINEIDEIEKITKHDVIAFLTYLSQFIGESSRFVHQGLTSSDVLDTCFNVQLVNASEILEKGLQNLLDVIKERALEHKNTICMGRSHGIFAEPTTFGLKLAQAYAEMYRNLQRLQNAR